MMGPGMMGPGMMGPGMMGPGMMGPGMMGPGMKVPGMKVQGMMGPGMMGPGMMGPGMMGPGMMGPGMMMPLQPFMWTAIAVISAIAIGIGAILIIGGYLIYRKPESAGKWGVAILVASIVGLFGMGGFFIGPILGIIGGILALTKR
jgi:hypothetical protein